MLDDILFFVSICFIILGYLYFIYIYLTNKKMKTDITSLDLAVKLFENNSINVIKSNKGIFSKYNIERKIVKLTDDSYDKNDYFSLAVISRLSFYSKIESKFLEFVGKIKKDISIIDYIPLLIILLNIICSSGLDIKIGIFVIGIILMYQYMFFNFNDLIVDKLNIEDEKLISVIIKFRQIDTLFFIGSLVSLIRLIILLF